MGSTPGTDAHAHPHGRLEHEDVAHEQSDVNVRGVIWFVVTLVVIGFVIHLVVYGLFKVFDRIEVRNDAAVSPLAEQPPRTPTGEIFPQPRLQTTPWLDLKDFRANEDAFLNSYGWVDQKGGVAHLPIDKAKALLLQRGLPASGGGQDPSEGTHAYAYGESTGGRSIPAGGPDRSSATPAPNAGSGAPGVAGKPGGQQ